ncbi:peptidoglycan recognition family protein [Companilactobacillus mishanensis]|uniref:N-acetylmuramoyl-L-alanine amidase n=1 Tax=Companilactobacillus mishanensis TaxID=2486008 RepID=A0A5P0ZF35_9LACO|nr:peptidoglycan recognition family protein [Companilactobacillus mishanensis]MQS44231.1 N-acetylmuramoyl-L-alanine amidase [Companilactobacillus mishanensis]MQS51664.1 N-acetylmuramoyl-L-alanine amidase [Companilactobacillus mishanensis]
MTEFNIDTSLALSDGEGSSKRVDSNKYIVLHETTNNGAWNNAHNEKVNWATQEAYVQYIIGDGGKIYSVGSEGYQAWGAGSYVNANSPVQIELARTDDEATFKKDYATYVEFARSKAKQFGIPCVLDESGNGVKTHYWVSKNIWGNHTDPVQSYLLPHWGITQEQLAHDIANGLDGDGSSFKPVTPITPQVSRDVVTIQGGPATGIAGWNSKGEIIKGSNSTFVNGTSWKANHIQLVNGLPMYQVSTDEFIPKKYTDQAGIITINAIAGVDAVNSKGEKWNNSSTTFSDMSKWQSLDNGCKVINNRLCFQVSTDQFIDAFYTIGGGNK